MGYGAIALADVDYLVVHDNIIENNGPSHLRPICGIFVLHGEGLEISRNRILNKRRDDGQSPQGAQAGPRGGIYVVYGIAPRVPIIPNQKDPYPFAERRTGNQGARQTSSARRWPGLDPGSAGTGVGGGNQFTSQGVIVRGDSTTFWATTVLILNLGPLQ